MNKTNKKPLLAVSALIVGFCAIPAAALIHWSIGVVLLALPIFMIYRAG